MSPERKIKLLFAVLGSIALVLIGAGITIGLLHSQFVFVGILAMGSVFFFKAFGSILFRGGFGAALTTG